MKRLIVLLAVALAACSGESVSTTTLAPDSDPPPTTTVSVASTSVASSTSSSVVAATTEAPPPTSPSPVEPTCFIVAVGSDGATYLDGEPPSGPAAYAVLDDGSVVIADTMALNLGTPRLLRFDRSGSALPLIDLLPLQVASVVDVVSDGQRLAILDIDVAAGRYRVIYLSQSGEVSRVVEIPNGYRLENGLSGLVWDDNGVLLEFEGGSRFARITQQGTIEPDAVPEFGGMAVVVRPLGGKDYEISFGDAVWTLTREEELGGVSVLGVGSDGELILSVDEVDVSGPAFSVRHRVGRYGQDGSLLSEQVIDANLQFVDIGRPLEVGANGTIFYLAANEESLELLSSVDGFEDRAP